VIVSEDRRRAGICADIASIVVEEAFDYLDAPIRCVASMDIPIPFSTVLEEKVLPQIEDIVNVVKEVSIK